MRSRYAAFLAGALLALAATVVAAEDYPRKPVKIIAQFAAGPGDVDLARRFVALLPVPASRDARRNAGFEQVRRARCAARRAGRNRRATRQGEGGRARPVAPSPSDPEPRPAAGVDWTFVTSGIASRTILRSAISFCVGDSEA